MKTLVASLFALLASVFILLVGHGVQLTVLPLIAQDLGWSTSEIGYTGSAYFLGFIIGCLTIPRLVANVGHIRVFGVLTSSATVALLTAGLLQELSIWLVVRTLTGWSIAGLYMVIESWLNERTNAENRGLVLSVYTVLTLISISIGQLTIGTGLNYTELLMVGAILLTLGSIPVGVTRSTAPAPIPVGGFQLAKVYKASHVAVAGAFIGGLATSSYWVLGPVVATTVLPEGGSIGIFLASAVLGGMLLQLPAGRLSDRVDRRLVLSILAFVGAFACALALLPLDNTAALYLAMFLLGGTTFPLYSISLAHANDNTSLSLIEVGSVILLVHSAGAVIGPIVTSSIMMFLPRGMFLFSGAILVVFGCWSLWRSFTHYIDRGHFEPFPDAPKTSLEVLEVIDQENEGQPPDLKNPDQNSSV